MIVNCRTCPVRDRRCDDCVVTALLAPRSAEGTSPHELRLDAAENRAVSVLVGAGLFEAGAVPRLRARPEALEHWAAAREVG